MQTQALKSMNQSALELLGVAAIEVVGSEIVIRPVLLEHVKHDDQDGVRYGHDGALFAFTRG